VSEALLRASVVLALPGNVQQVEVELGAGATLRDAVSASGILSQADVKSESLVVGVFNHVQPLGALVRDGSAAPACRVQKERKEP
jgi:putative ubiquitin-RnfH superfamily antitoxin RatB of RatAB toxin-antitoxin module